ncbi:EAL domain-containing protein [Breoghania sp.]|uniref:EAL domain-containing protein n=1 Tax=Breoghania sp. TaxID=2065378 RepID=UPI0026064204|nr:EAL domain-containing protein [Breoghania sp.]MDJ0930127.1 EAL domain-containing protein [Breoghania sp.]
MFSALLIVLGVLPVDMRREYVNTAVETQRLGQISTIWSVAATAALHPGDPEEAKVLAQISSTKAPVLTKLLKQLAKAETANGLLQRIREDLPTIADPMRGRTAMDGPEMQLSRLLAVQLPEVLWRLAALREDTHQLAARNRLGPNDRMRFLVNTGQFKAAADFAEANRNFQIAAKRLAWTVNVASVSLPSLSLNPHPLDKAYLPLVKATLALHNQAYAYITTDIHTDLSNQRWALTGIAVTIIIATLLALSLALSLSSSIVRAITSLEGRIRAIADDDGDAPVLDMPEREKQSELARVAEAVVESRDRVARKVAAAEQDEKRRDLELLFESNPLPLILHEPETGRIVAVNGTAVDHYHYTQEEFTGLRVTDLKAPNLPIADEPGDGRPTVRHVKANGEIIEVLPFEREIRYDGQHVNLTTIVDITAHRQAETRLVFLAHFDPLTHLVNRVMLQKNLAEEIQNGHAHADYDFSVLCLDLDRFKIVNDTLGHDAGNQVLQMVANRLLTAVDASDKVAGLGGDEWVLNEACREVAQWPNDVKVAVNVSSYQFRSSNLVYRVCTALRTSGLEPHRLELEITESVLLADSEATIRTLHEIHSLGVRIAMDDFGTGYSSLSYLRAFHFDKVKIDRSFISDLGNTVEANAIIRAIAGLSNELGMTTTAEGVETEEQLRHIRAHGCSQAQGFLTGCPVPAQEARVYASGQTEGLCSVLSRMRDAVKDATQPKRCFASPKQLAQ